MSWTEEKVAKLKELWGKGNTASQIAEIIGGISRNAVIGKAHRLNLSAKIKTRTATSNENFENSSLHSRYHYNLSLESFSFQSQGMVDSLLFPVIDEQNNTLDLKGEYAWNIHSKRIYSNTHSYGIILVYLVSQLRNLEKFKKNGIPSSSIIYLGLILILIRKWMCSQLILQELYMDLIQI